jgi:hypothetical protein
MNFKHVCAVTFLILYLPHQALWADKESNGKSKNFSIEWRAERLDILANNAPLTEVMLSIADKTGLEIHGIEYLKGTIQANVIQQPLPTALKELLQRANYLLQESPVLKNAHPVLSDNR